MVDSLPLKDVTLVLAFLVPGFIALSVRSQFMTGTAPSQNGERFLTYISVSVIYGTLVFRLVDPALMGNSVFVYLGAVFGGPVVVGLLLGINIQRNLIRGLISRIGLFTVHALPTAWDWKFGGVSEEQWVLVSLKNGVTFGGLFGRESFAASSADERDLYIQWIYDINDDGTWSSPGRKGVLIAADEISTIEFWQYSTEDDPHE